jgi:catechol 2,3-dioxygenase-like lactoylglutathione lyase family enzyme
MRAGKQHRRELPLPKRVFAEILAKLRLLPGLAAVNRQLDLLDALTTVECETLDRDRLSRLDLGTVGQARDEGARVDFVDRYRRLRRGSRFDAGAGMPQRMVDPDGNRVKLVPPGYDGVTQIAVAMAVRSLSEHLRFYGDTLGFAEQSWSGGPAFRLGDSLILLQEDRAASIDPVRQARGWRYITLQVADIDAVHEELRSKGVREGLAPITLGDVARISMILDPDGNWIELSRRASIVGTLS